jgi:hypothetical protein
VDAVDPATGAVYRKKHLYSDPDGVNIMLKLPSIADDPGLRLVCFVCPHAAKACSRP